MDEDVRDLDPGRVLRAGEPHRAGPAGTLTSRRLFAEYPRPCAAVNSAARTRSGALISDVERTPSGPGGVEAAMSGNVSKLFRTTRWMLVLACLGAGLFAGRGGPRRRSPAPRPA